MDSHRVERLRQIKSFPSLVKYLRDDLDWPIEVSDFDELTFDYEPDELGIDKTNAAKIQEIKQLRPLAANQPYGIFFLKFEPKHLPVVVLRRILSQLVIKKRASGRRVDQPAWHLNDLLFISNYGDQQQRQITFAQFANDETIGDLPVLRVLGWDDADTFLHLDHVDGVLTEKLRWPSDDSDANKWRTQWSSAFVLRHREVITTSKQLSLRLAELAKRIRNRAKLVLAVEAESGVLRKLHKSFKTALIHDLSEDDFADMYAQTIAYGLLAARVSRPVGITADNLTDLIPITNPFLREMLSTFLKAGGRKGGIDFDELGVQDVVDLLNNPDTHIEDIMRDFGNRTRQEDPVIHFYELFLKEYDKKKKVERGVFYTPQPVVSYIVRSVDELLRTEFGLEDGLADTTTWGEMVKRTEGLTIPGATSPDQAFVQILDPATGTGTFLVEVIDVVYRRMTEKWKREKRLELELNNLWNEYVPKHLLPRLHGYELLMAPYAIAHLKIGLKLYETGYRFGSDQRARIYLTNALEPASSLADATAAGLFEALGHEAQAVNEIKRKQRFTVVIGNPPYSGESANKIPWIRDLVKSKYEYIESRKIEEKGKKNWLLNDYVKFIRLAHHIVEKSSVGVIGVITPHSYLDNPTFRGMRYSLITDFRELFILDLHGNYDKREKCPNGSKDENVFDITQGVCISLFVRMSGCDIASGTKCAPYVADLWGLRDEVKSVWLLDNSYVSKTFSQVDPDNRFYFFKKGKTRDEQYDSWWSLNKIFEVNGNGVITAHDHFSIAFHDRELGKNLDIFIDFELSDAEVLKRLQLQENSMWNIADARESLRVARPEKRFVDVLYRPFDIRRTFFHKSVVFNLRLPVMKHMVMGGNIALICSRMTKGEQFAHALVSRTISEAILLSSKTSNNAFSFPLNRLRSEGEHSLFSGAHSRFESNLSARYLSDLSSKMQKSTSEKWSSDPREVLGYIYAILYSPSYRNRYGEFLNSDFPRLPLTTYFDLFQALAALGLKLVAVHMLESSVLDNFITTYTGPKNPEVEKVGWSDNTVWLNVAATKKGLPATIGTIGFHGVPEAVWNFHIGGYQVCEKWLKDRKGRVLSKDDIIHYQKIVVALSETISLMAEIDKVIDQHGGWPGAFK